MDDDPGFVGPFELLIQELAELFVDSGMMAWMNPSGRASRAVVDRMESGLTMSYRMYPFMRHDLTLCFGDGSFVAEDTIAQEWEWHVRDDRMMADEGLEPSIANARRWCLVRASHACVAHTPHQPEASARRSLAESSLTLFEVAHFESCPEGAETNQPRATPWGPTNDPNRPSPERAQHGKATRFLSESPAKRSSGMSRPVLPLQGMSYSRVPVPRALPWADLWLPLSGRRTKAQLQN